MGVFLALFVLVVLMSVFCTAIFYLIVGLAEFLAHEKMGDP